MKDQSHSGSLDPPTGLRGAGQWPCPHVTAEEMKFTEIRAIFAAGRAAPGTQRFCTPQSYQHENDFGLDGVLTGFPCSDSGKLDSWSPALRTS